MPAIRPIHRPLGTHCLLLAGILVFHGCQAPRLPPATGSPLDIVVLGEPVPAVGFEALRRSLSQSFAPWIVEDPGVRLLPASGASEPRRPREKNILLLGRLGSTSLWETMVGAWLRPEAREHLARRGAGWFVFRDVWARGQEVVLVVARNTEGLDSLLCREAPALRLHWQRSILERCLESTWPDTATVVARELQRIHGFVLAVPQTYTLLPPASTWPGAVEMVRRSPSRTVCVFWLDGVDAARLLDDEYLLGMQRDFMWRLHADEAVDGSMVFETPSWDPGRRVLRGSWQNQRDVAGGAFATHFVYDAPRRRLYGIQALLFAPGRRKAVYGVELEALLRTFHVERGA